MIKMRETQALSLITIIGALITITGAITIAIITIKGETTLFIPKLIMGLITFTIGLHVTLTGIVSLERIKEEAGERGVLT